MDNKTDEEIAKLVATGNLELFSTLVRRYEGKIKRYGRKFLSGREDIEDIAQNIFIKAYRNIKSFEPKRKFSSWIYRIAHNEFINALKKKKREPLRFFDPDVIFPFLAGKNKDYGLVIDKEILEKNLDKLETKYKEVIVLRYYSDLSYKEISEILAVPTSTVGIRIKRAVNKLKTIYEGQNN